MSKAEKICPPTKQPQELDETEDLSPLIKLEGQVCKARRSGRDDTYGETPTKMTAADETATRADRPAAPGAHRVSGVSPTGDLPVSTTSPTELEAGYGAVHHAGAPRFRTPRCTTPSSTSGQAPQRLWRASPEVLWSFG